MSGIVKPLLGSSLNLDHPLSRGLVGSWLLNEGSGLYANDSSGQNNTGTLTSLNDPPIATSGWGPGPHGGALAFDGVNDYVDIPDNKILDGFDGFSLVIKAKINAAPVGLTRGGLVHKWKLANYAYFLGLDAALKINAGENYSVGGGYGIVSNSSLGLNQYYQIVYTSTTAFRICYIDGALDKSASNGWRAGNIINSSANLKIATHFDGSWYQNCDIDSVMIYNRALSADEIAYLYAFPYCMFEPEIFPAWLKRAIIEHVMPSMRPISSVDRTLERLMLDDRELMEIIAIILKSRIL